MNILLMAITALSTCATAMIAFFTLKNDREEKSLSLFSESIRVVLDGKHNSQSKDYILSKKYDEDIETVKRYLGLKKEKNVNLRHYEDILFNNQISDDNHYDEKELEAIKKRLHKSYRKIEYFCDKMDYLGILAEDKSVRTLIINYYRPTIVSTYQILQPLIDATRNERDPKDLYKHFTDLYNMAKQS